MKKTTITIFITLALVLTYLLSLNLFQPAVTPINADGVESITLVTGAHQSAYSCSLDQINTFAEAFNQARHFRNDMGTTPPARVDVSFDDGTQLTVWGYNQGFATLKSANGPQQNIRGKALEEWFRNVIADLA